MEGVPEALRAGTPVPDALRAGTPVPNALRVGTPVMDKGQSPFQTYPSALRRTSAASNSDLYASASRRTSNYELYSSPATYDAPHTFENAPSLPPLPVLSDAGGYAPVADPFQPQGLNTTFNPSRKRSLLSKLGSIRSTRTRGSRYGHIEDEEAGQGFGRESMHQPLKNLEEDEDETEALGFDLSSFDSPIALHTFGQKADSAVGSRDVGIGEGMNWVLSATLHNPGPHGHRRAISVTDPETRNAAQEVAQKRGEILAVEEYPDDYPEDDAASMADISSIGGSEYIRRKSRATIVGTEEDTKKSYFFPKDPEQPAWRPFSMRKPYISLLITIALTLGIVQELVCQISIRKSKNDDGLLKFDHPQELTMLEYFTWKYMPTIVLLTFGIMWQIVDYEVKRLEPYYQLSRRDGATARDSLNQDYLTFLSYLVPLKAVHSKQWAVMYSSIATLMAGGLIPVLQSASVVMLPVQSERKDDEPKYVRIVPAWSRAMSASLLCIAIFGVLLLISLRRKSGLLSDPKGIAGIAAMATKSHILNDFKGLDTAPNNVIHEQLRTRRYNLHKSSLWQGEYIRHDEKIPVTKQEHPHPILLRLSAGIPFIGYMIVFACVIPIFMFVGSATVVTEKVPWLLTALATVVKLLWGCLDMNLRVIEPYYILSQRNAPPKTLTTDYTGTVPGFLSYQAARNGQYLVAFVGAGAILAEILTVCVTSFSVDGRKFIAGNGSDPNDPNNDRYNTAETFRSFWISLGLATAIIVYLCVVATIVYVRRSHKFFPRQPGTIAGVLAFIHQSKMLDDFIDTEKMNSKEMTKHLEGIGKTYALGWFKGRDGEDHCGVDWEPILAPYVHGFDWRKSRLQGNQVGTWEQY
jgi:hypothetical protein